MTDGSPQAGRLADLYRIHADDALRLAFLLTGDPWLAQDIVQEAFVKLAGRLVHLRKRGAFGAYLRRTIVNLARMQFRKRRRERASIERHAGLRQPVSPEPDPVESETLRTSLMRLSERQRAAVVLRFYEDLSDSQTAEILRCAPGTVRSLVTRAMETLRQEVER